MKTERRHELQKNELADQLNRSIDTVRPYSSTIGMVAIVGLLVALGIFYLSQQSRHDVNEAWQAYYMATNNGADAEKLREIAKDYPGTPVEDWARLAAADQGLMRGTQLIFQDKASAKSFLNNAAAEYRILQESAKVEAVRDRASFNLALAYEGLGQVDKAVEAYRAVGGTLAQVAQARAEELSKDQDVKQFYDWFASAEPPSPFLPQGGLPPGHRPGFDVDPSGEESFLLPKNIGDVNSAFGAGSPIEEPRYTDEPGTTDETPEAPATETPATEAPATDEAPLAPEPAAETDEAAPVVPATETPDAEAPATDAPATETPAVEGDAPVEPQAAE